MRAQVEVRQFIERRPKARSPYGNKFMMLSQRGVEELSERLADRTLGLQALRVLFAMMQSLDWENRVQCSQKDLGLSLGMSSQEVSKASRLLAECGFIERIENRRGWYRVSPRLCWRGSVKNLEAALRDREAA